MLNKEREGKKDIPSVENYKSKLKFENCPFCNLLTFSFSMLEQSLKVDAIDLVASSRTACRSFDFKSKMLFQPKNLDSNFGILLWGGVKAIPS
jgi:transcription elongation factor Elf1